MTTITGPRGTANVEKSAFGWVASFNGQYSDTCRTRREATACAATMVGR